MPNPNFPFGVNGARMDSSKYELEIDDPAIKSPTEGGYEYSRPRFTRKPRKNFSVGYTMLTDAQRNTLVTFYENMAGGSVIFDWYNQEDGVTYAVRFDGSLSFSYSGMGNTKLWDCSFKLRQA